MLRRKSKISLLYHKPGSDLFHKKRKLILYHKKWRALFSLTNRKMIYSYGKQKLIFYHKMKFSLLFYKSESDLLHKKRKLLSPGGYARFRFGSYSSVLSVIHTDVSSNTCQSGCCLPFSQER